MSTSCRVMAWLACLYVPLVYACGPTPQKVVASIEVHAPAASVMQVLSRPESMTDWHPMVQEISVTPAVSVGEANAVIRHRVMRLRNGWALQEDLRQPGKSTVVEDSLMSGGSFPVSQYRGVLELRPSADQATVTLVWSARFNNRANLLDAPQGQDNATAIAAVTTFYQQGLQGLKHYLEAAPDQYSSHIKQAKEN